MTNLSQIEEIISNIPDPEIPVITIKELGVLRKIEQLEDKIVVTITPTYSGCPAMGQFQKEIKEQLEFLKVSSFEIKLQYDPAWTTDWITEHAKKKLKKYGIAPPPHSTSDKTALMGQKQEVNCPKCNATRTRLVSQFSSTACKAMYQCEDCLEPFEYFKCL